MTVGIRIARVGRTLGLLMHVGICLGSLSQEILELTGIVGNCIEEEGQTRRELDTGLLANLAAQDTLG